MLINVLSVSVKALDQRGVAFFLGKVFKVWKVTKNHTCFAWFDQPLASRHWNTVLVSSGVSLTSWSEGASLVLVGQLSSDGMTTKIPSGVNLAPHLFLLRWLKMNMILLLSIETDLGRWALGPLWLSQT